MLEKQSREMETAGPWFVGVDVGGTNIECGVMDGSGKVVSRLRRPTLPGEGQEAVIGRIAGMATEAAVSAGLSIGRISAVGIGNPGFIDPIRGISLDSVNLGWRNVPTADLLTARLGLPVYVENDVKTYVYGEAMAGAGVGFRYVFGLTIGTGLAGAFVSDGSIFGGGDFLAGEIGHIPFDEIGYRCNCGLNGCLETMVSATGIARQAADAVKQGAGGILAERYAHAGAITAKDVHDAYTEGDPTARSVLDRTGRLLGKALSFVVPVLSPDVIIIGGGAAQAGAALLGPMEEELRGRLLPAYAERLQIRQAALGHDAGVIGNALYAKMRSGTV